MVEIGEKLGSLELYKSLGSGGHGSVWAAHCSKRNVDLAVKILHPALITQKVRKKGPNVAERFVAEAKLLQSLHHPGLCKIYDVFDEEKHNVFAYSMELLHGADLTVAYAYLKLSELLNVFAKTADTLQYLHDNNVVHRDIKPANIFINQTRNKNKSVKQVKLLDFGVAKEVHQEALLSETATGVFVGSIQTMAPESFTRWNQDEAQKIQPQLDQWALGVSLYQCLTGGLPFQGQNVVEILMALEETDPPPLQLRAEYGHTNVLPAIQELVSRMLEKHPTNRFNKMSDIALAFRQITNKLGGGVGTVVTSADFFEKPSTAESSPPQTEPLAPSTNKFGETVNARRPTTPERMKSPAVPATHKKNKKTSSRKDSPVKRASVPPTKKTTSPRSSTRPETTRIGQAIVRISALEFYLWLLAIFVLGFIAGLVVHDL